MYVSLDVAERPAFKKILSSSILSAKSPRLTTEAFEFEMNDCLTTRRELR